MRHRLRGRAARGGRSVPLGQPDGHAARPPAPRRAAARRSLVAASPGSVGRLEAGHAAADRARPPRLRGGLPPGVVRPRRHDLHAGSARDREPGAGAPRDGSTASDRTAIGTVPRPCLRHRRVLFPVVRGGGGDPDFAARRQHPGGSGFRHGSRRSRDSRSGAGWPGRSRRGGNRGPAAAREARMGHRRGGGRCPGRGRSAPDRPPGPRNPPVPCPGRRLRDVRSGARAARYPASGSADLRLHRRRMGAGGRSVRPGGSPHQ